VIGKLLPAPTLLKLRRERPMKSTYRYTLFVSALLLVTAAHSAAKPSPSPNHPAYLHALADLRDARAHLQRPDGGELRDQEKKAVHEIDDAINEIKKASIDDGKDVNDHPPVDVALDWRGRLHKALELVNKAHNDVAREEDNSFAQGLQQRALDHIDKAHRHIEEAIQVVQ
jgi:tetratricopeptide (TPR) repeat protein